MGYKIDKRTTIDHTHGMLKGGPLCKCPGCALERNQARGLDTLMPLRTQQDVRGNPLEIGTRVAFNYSGDTAIGVITAITGGYFSIERETHPKNDHKVSKVKKATSMLAIYEGEDKGVDVPSLMQEIGDLRTEARSQRVLLSKIADAWDLSEVEIYLEEQYGEDWKDKIGNHTT